MLFATFFNFDNETYQLILFNSLNVTHTFDTKLVTSGSYDC